MYHLIIYRQNFGNGVMIKKACHQVSKLNFWRIFRSMLHCLGYACILRWNSVKDITHFVACALNHMENLSYLIRGKARIAIVPHTQHIGMGWEGGAICVHLSVLWHDTGGDLLCLWLLYDMSQKKRQLFCKNSLIAQWDNMHESQSTKS